MSTLRSLILAIATAAALAACSYNPSYEGATCSPGGICPGDLICDTDNVCKANPSGGIDAPDDDTDAPPNGDGGIDAEIDAAPDVTPPNTILASSPSAISGPSVTFIMDSTEVGSTFRCSVDSTVLMPCTATQMFSALAAGAHTFRAAATDMAGNEDPTPVEYTWMVDLNVLDTSITMGPSGTSGPNPTFRFSSTRPGTFECMISPGESAFTSCSSPKSYTGLTQIGAPGYTFQVRARDTAGNLDDTPATQTFLVDATGPTVSISAPVNGSTVGTSITLNFNTESGATYTCQLDSAAVINPCANGRVFMGLTSATGHTIRVTGTDSFGNVGATASNTFTTDDQGPSVTVSGSPSAGQTVNATSANLAFQIVPSNEPAPFSFECRFNSTGAFSTCTSFVQSGLLDGPQALEVRARDRFNNVGPITTHGWSVMPLFTTILNVRTGGIALGTRVQINNNANNVRVTGKTNNRFWIQEANGNAVPVPSNRGITVMPTGFTGSDPTIVPGRTLSVTGTVANMNGNLVLAQATFINGSVLAAYNPKDTNRDSINLLNEGNEGMFVNMSGRASSSAAPSCQNFDFCIVSCERPTPVIDSIDGSPTGVMINRDHNYLGIVEGNGTGYTYYVNDAQETSDACL